MTSATRPATKTRSAATAKERLYGGLSQSERKSERRERFIEAGVVAFGSAGFAGATTRSLCAEAGLTQRYFYESFTDMQALFMAVLRVLGERLERTLMEAVERAADQPPQAQLRAALTAYFQLLKKDVHVARILLVEVYSTGPHTGELALRFNDRISELLRMRMDAAIPSLREHGNISKLMAAALVGGTHHLALKWMRGGFREPASNVAEIACTMYFGSAFALASSPLVG